MFDESDHTISPARRCAQIRQQQRLSAIRPRCSTGTHFWDECHGSCAFDSVECLVREPIAMDSTNLETERL